MAKKRSEATKAVRSVMKALLRAGFIDKKAMEKFDQKPPRKKKKPAS